jgi:hypothetical protein
VDELGWSGLIERRTDDHISTTAAGRIVLDQMVLRLSSALEAVERPSLRVDARS